MCSFCKYCCILTVYFWSFNRVLFIKMSFWVIMLLFYRWVFFCQYCIPFIGKYRCLLKLTGVIFDRIAFFVQVSYLEVQLSCYRCPFWWDRCGVLFGRIAVILQVSCLEVSLSFYRCPFWWYCCLLHVSFFLSTAVFLQVSILLVSLSFYMCSFQQCSIAVFLQVSFLLALLSFYRCPFWKYRCCGEHM